RGRAFAANRAFARIRSRPAALPRRGRSSGSWQRLSSRTSRSSLPPRRALSQHVIRVHINHLVNQSKPPIATWVVGGLLCCQSVYQGRPHVEVDPVAEPGGGETSSHLLEHLHGQGIGLRRGLEIRDRPLEQ